MIFNINLIMLILHCDQVSNKIANCLILLGSRFNYGAKLPVRELEVRICQSGRKYMCLMVE